MGWRARIGLVYPDDSDSDDEYAAMVPAGCSVHAARNDAPSSEDIVGAVRAQLFSGAIATATRMLRPVRPDAVAYACSSRVTERWTDSSDSSPSRSTIG